MSKEQKFISQELRFEFEDNEILHIDNGSIKIHTALAKDQFGIERIYHKLINEQKVQPESIVSHLVGNQILVIAARGVEIFLHQRDEEDKQVPANSLELWNLEKPYITGNQSSTLNEIFIVDVTTKTGTRASISSINIPTLVDPKNFKDFFQTTN